MGEELLKAIHAELCAMHGTLKQLLAHAESAQVSSAETANAAAAIAEFLDAEVEDE